MGRLRKKGGKQDKKGDNMDEVCVSFCGAMVILLLQGDIQRLRHSIQTLCQSTNPLGKCMDYVHEVFCVSELYLICIAPNVHATIFAQDMDTMKKELDMWKAEYSSKLEEYDVVRQETEEMVRPLSQSRAEIEEKIEEQRQKIYMIKVSFHPSKPFIFTLTVCFLF
jgi:hypothetical protein